MVTDWEPFAGLRFEFAPDVAPADEPLAGDWVDLSSRLRPDVKIEFGTGDDYAEFDLNNRDRVLDPTNPSAPYNLAPYRHARLRHVLDGTTRPLFRGFIEKFPPYWPGYNEGQVRARIVDALEWVAVNRDVERPAESTSERVHALLDLVGWPASRRDIQDGLRPLEAIDVRGANVRQLVDDCVDAEQGDLWVAPDGVITFRNRHARHDLTATVQFGDPGIRTRTADPRWGKGDIVNMARFDHASGDSVTWTDDGSIAAYRERPHSVPDLPIALVEGEAIARWTVIRNAQPHVRVDNLSVEAREHLATLLDRRLGELAEFTHTPPGDGTANETGHIEVISHSITKGSWEIAFALSPYHGEGPWFTLDDPVRGRLDAGNKLAP